MGHRIAKTVYQVRTSDGALTDLGTTLYTRDLQGNVLAVYRTDTWPTQEAGTRGGNRRNEWFEAIIQHAGVNADAVFNTYVGAAIFKTNGNFGPPNNQQLGQLRTRFLAQNWAGPNGLDQYMAQHKFAFNACLLNSLVNTYYALHHEALTPLLFAAVTHQYGQYKWRQAEAHIYGSSRLGLEHTNVESKDTLEYRFRLPLTCASNDWTAWLLYEDAPDVPQNLYVRGDKHYELTNHLGNVLATITDRRRHGDNFAPGAPVVAWFAETANAQMYWPFGSVVTEYQFTASWAGDYRYGFNGKEFDPEWGNQYDYGFRIYNPQVARFLSVDPLMGEYPSWSPYPFAMNRPIDGIDLDGLEWQDSDGNDVDGPYSQEYAASQGWTRRVDMENVVIDANNSPTQPSQLYVTLGEDAVTDYEVRRNPYRWGGFYFYRQDFVDITVDSPEGPINYRFQSTSNGTIDLNDYRVVVTYVNSEPLELGYSSIIRFLLQFRKARLAKLGGTFGSALHNSGSALNRLIKNNSVRTEVLPICWTKKPLV